VDLSTLRRAQTPENTGRNGPENGLPDSQVDMPGIGCLGVEFGRVRILPWRVT